ncbi:unnamed protein product (macronuclear) [Paramecium tetraurelia]|uniref:Glycosyl hydrolase family 31 C-terminal domain-containing protein n=1 Tax=Paramecium tetraurelia TaxID=5888 RepID=A0CUL4_PARTE|nr:uncharacterized protein GSPATT00010681001 [Paramecium tetraurelia]CAK74481.1 unnamed protein product [Paramecium tetraurelia]|eukprot:XP_001441878.1 hypothetical protein (macronuclear) [Paramecium tetraurelia strain d4-2]
MYTQLQNQGQQNSNKLRFNWKIILILLPFALGLGIYFSITSGQPKNDPDQTLKVRQPHQQIPYFYISTYEECKKELTLSIDNYTTSFELPKQYPFAYTKCERSERQDYSYHLQESLTSVFQLNKQNTPIIEIIQVNYYLEFSEVLFNLIDQKILGYEFAEQNSPAYFIRTNNNIFYSFVIYTSSNVESIYQNSLLQIRVYGGRVNIKFFLYDKPEQIIKAYHQFIGGYKLFPFWSLGYQYFGTWIEEKDLKYLESKSIPLEMVWIDEQKNNYLPPNYRKIKVTYPTVQLDTVDKKYLIKEPNKEPFQGCVDDEHVNYIDYNVQNTIQKETQLHPNSEYSGAMLKSFVNNEITENGKCQGRNIGIDKDAFHFSNKHPVLLEKKVTEQYFRPLNSFAQSKQYSEHSNNVKLIMSESAFFGQGQFSGIIFDSVDLEQTIAHLIYNNFFGLPYTGSYGCDQGKSNLNWCARWLSIQAWMPLFMSRSTSKFQFSNHPDYFDQIYLEVKARQSLNKWMFAQFLKNYDSKVNAFTGTIIQPIWWFNTSDTRAYQYEDREFIFGEVFLVAPIIEDPENEYSTEYDIYFPQGDFWMETKQPTLFMGGSHVAYLILSNTQTPCFQKAGSIVFKQDSINLKMDYLNNIYNLYVVFSRQGTDGNAEGIMITLQDMSDENVKKKCYENGNNCLMKVKMRYVYDQNTRSEHYFISCTGINKHTVFEQVQINTLNLFHSKLQMDNQITLKHPIIIKDSFKTEYDLQQYMY